jgi:ABC-type bacteriocin/lantibiotic exporter with double-glycine peptidase domain
MGIYLENVSFFYGDKNVLSNINLAINTGEHIGIIGSSGCGKSTLLKLLSGLYESQIGKVIVDDKTHPIEIRKSVALVMQNAMLLPTTIIENITCGHPISDDQIKKACDAAYLTEWINTLPDGIHTYVGERGSKVSGGQAQRIAIARAIAKQAPVMLFDEATSALDKETKEIVLLAFKQLLIGKTVISVAHNLDALRDCTRIYRLEGGRFYAS